MPNQFHTGSHIDTHLRFLAFQLSSIFKILITLEVEEEVRTGRYINTQHTAQTDGIFQIDRYVQPRLLHIKAFHLIAFLRIQQRTVHSQSYNGNRYFRHRSEKESGRVVFHSFELEFRQVHTAFHTKLNQLSLGRHSQCHAAYSYHKNTKELFHNSIRLNFADKYMQIIP